MKLGDIITANANSVAAKLGSKLNGNRNVREYSAYVVGDKLLENSNDEVFLDEDFIQDANGNPTNRKYVRFYNKTLMKSCPASQLYRNINRTPTNVDVSDWATWKSANNVASSAFKNELDFMKSDVAELAKVTLKAAPEFNGKDGNNVTVPLWVKE